MGRQRRRGVYGPYTHCIGTISKCIGVFEGAVWQEAGLIGRAFHPVNPMSELHDPSSDTAPARFGFVPPGTGPRPRPPGADPFERRFGVRPPRLLAQRWWDEPYTTAGGVEDPRLSGHAVLRRLPLGGRLHLASCETSGVSPGHLDRTIERAQAVTAHLSTPGPGMRWGGAGIRDGSEAPWVR